MTADEVRQIAATFVASPQFQALWDDVLRQAHPQLQQVLLGRDTDLVTSSGGKVVLDLDRLGRLVQERLVANGVAIAATITISDSNWSLTLYDSPRLAAVQRATNLLQQWVPWAVVLAVTAFVLALLVAPRRLAALRWIGIGLLVGAVLVGAGLAVGRVQYLAAVEGTVPSGAASAAYDVLLDPLTTVVRVWFAVALAARGDRCAGRTARRRAARRRRLSRALGSRPAAALSWCGLLAVALGVVVWWDRPHGPVLVVTAGVVAAAVVAVLILSEGVSPRRSRTSAHYDS